MNVLAMIDQSTTPPAETSWQLPAGMLGALLLAWVVLFAWKRVR
jgi:hypothetical protein